MTVEHSVSVMLFDGKVDYLGTGRQVPQPWIKIADAPLDGLATSPDGSERPVLEQLQRIGARDVVIVDTSTRGELRQRLVAVLQQRGFTLQAHWPPVRVPGEPPAAVARLFLAASITDGPGAFGRSYRRALEDTAYPEEVEALIDEAATRIEAMVREFLAASPLASMYGLRNVTAVGSTRRGTYAHLPADFDLIVQTDAPQDRIDRELVRRLVGELADDIGESPVFVRLCDRWALGSAGQRPRLCLASLAPDGPHTLLARLTVDGSPGAHALPLPFLDISIGAIPRPIGYERWWSRYVGQLDEVAHRRLRHEIRLCKRVLRRLPGVSGSPGGLGAYAIEQWVVQATKYRCPGIDIGTMDNVMMLVAEEGTAGDQVRPFADFKASFPVWHPGVWEHDVVPADTPDFNMLDLLGRGDEARAQELWSVLVRSAASYRRARAAEQPWLTAELPDAHTP